MRTLAIVLVALLAFTACGRVEPDAGTASQAATITAQTSPIPTAPLTQTYTCTDPQYGYTIAIPADWQIVEDTPCSPRFRGPGNPAPGSLPFNSDKLYAGGVNVLGPLQTKDPEAEMGWRLMLPNHSQERAMAPVATAAGPGRVFSLERDREPEAQQDGARVWWAQHTAIPAGPFSYDIWVQVGPDDLGPPVPVLAAMLASFTRTTPGGTPVPVAAQPVELNGVAWTLPQPEGIQPLAAANAEGVLWVQFPPLFTTEGTARYGLPPITSGAYRLMWTPWRTEGGALETGAQEVGQLPSLHADGVQTITTLAPAGERVFWAATYSLPDGAQNGGQVRVVRLDPERGEVRELLQLRGEGGGHVARRAFNDRWLFWNSSDVNEPRGQALLLDLVSGEHRPLDLGGTNWTSAAEWQADGLLLVTRADDGSQLLVDPTTTTMTPVSEAMLPAPQATETAGAGPVAPARPLVDPALPPAVAGQDGYEYIQVATADFDSDGTPEQAFLIANAPVQNGDPLWDDGHVWQLYVEEPTGQRTYLFVRFLQLARVEARLTQSAAGEAPRILLNEQWPMAFYLYELGYRGPDSVEERVLVERELVVGPDGFVQP
jgi:hypothetical protein